METYRGRYTPPVWYHIGGLIRHEVGHVVGNSPIVSITGPVYSSHNSETPREHAHTTIGRTDLRRE